MCSCIPTNVTRRKNKKYSCQKSERFHTTTDNLKSLQLPVTFQQHHHSNKVQDFIKTLQKLTTAAFISAHSWLHLTQALSFQLI